MKYCSKCGKEIHEEAVVCIHCGCSVDSAKKESTESKILEKYKSDVNSAYIFSIIGLVLSFGIGFVFAIISFIKCSNCKNLTSIDNLNDYERIEFEEAKKKLKTAESLSAVSLAIFIILMGVIFTMSLV